MKKLMTLMVSAFTAATAFGQHTVSCSFTSISSNITTNTTLSASTLYRLEGCIHVTSGATLTIPAGTRIMGQKSSTTSGALIIDKGAYLNAQGTSSSRIVFTSDQTPGNQAPGDWAGLIVAGSATNNNSGVSIDIKQCSTVTGGGANDADSSGVLKYIQIEYATSGLSLLCAGNKTVIDNIEVAYPSKDAFDFLGGTVRAKHLVSYNAYQNDFFFDYGNRSLVQYGVAVRLDASAHVAAGSNGIVMSNNENGAGSYAGTPKTHPVLSDFSLLGPLYCGASGISSDYKNGVLMYHNTDGGVYNSFIAGYPTGLRMEDLSTLQNADVNFTLNFSENSFKANTTNYSNNSTWPASCAASLSDWITNAGGLSCSQPNNDFSAFTSGYSSTICGSYCTTPPTFVLGTNTMLTSDYSATDLSNAFFVTGTSKHGGFNTTSSWAATWPNWCPSSYNPCTGMKHSGTTGVQQSVNEDASLQLAPNPSEGTTYAVFGAALSGRVNITLTDNVTGKVMRTVSTDVAQGTQRISLDTKGLSTGLYTVSLQQADGSVQHARLLVK